MRYLALILYLFTELRLASTPTESSPAKRLGGVLIQFYAASESSPALPEVLFEDFKLECEHSSGLKCFFHVYADTKESLFSKLENLEISEDIAIAKVLILAHGQSGAAIAKSYDLQGELTGISEIDFISFRGQNPVRLHLDAQRGRPVEQIRITNSIDDYSKLAVALEPLRRHMAEDVEVYCASCRIFAGNQKVLKEKAELLGKLLAIKSGRLYANSTYGFMNGTIFRPRAQLSKRARGLNDAIYFLLIIASGSAAVVVNPLLVVLGPASILALEFGSAAVFNRGYEAEFNNFEIASIKPQKAEQFLE